MSKRPTTKTEIIERYGEQYYEELKRKCREAAYRKYHADPEKARARVRKWDAENIEHKREYARQHRIIYRINSRDRNRLANKGLVPEGMIAHHMKYHGDKNDKGWLDDIVFMTREEHTAWHEAHPDFRAIDNVV